MRILITGGNGFIASHLAESLIKRGHDLSLLDTNFGKNTLDIDCKKFVGDVREVKALNQITAHPDIIFHAAAVSRVAWGEVDPRRCVEVNTVGLINIIMWANKSSERPHMIFASSREVYGEPEVLPVVEGTPKRPVSVYGISKLMSEKMLDYLGHSMGTNYTIIRFSNVYGSRRDLPERVIPSFVRNALLGEPLEVYGGNQVLDFCFIHDVTSGLLKVIDKIEGHDQAVQNNDFQFTTSVGHSVKNLADMVKIATNSNSEIEYHEPRSYDVTRFIGDFSKAKKLLGYTPRVKLEVGIKKYLHDVVG